MAYPDEVSASCGIRDAQILRLQGREMQVAAHQMPVVLWKQNQIAGGHIEHVHAIGQPYLAAAFGKEMEEHHMIGPGKPRPNARHAVFPPQAPRRGELRVEVERAFEAHRFENVRQGIHGVLGKKRGVSAKSRCGMVRILAPRQTGKVH